MTQDQVPDPTNPQGVQGQDPSTVVASPDAINKPSNEPATPEEAQAQLQASQTDPVKDLQRIANERQVQIYQLQQQLASNQQLMLEQMRIQSPQEVEPQNPFEFNTDYPSWARWENKQTAKLAAKEAREGMMQELRGYAATQAEVQWAQSHPQVDINMVKSFAQMRGISNLDDAYTLMNLPQMQSQVASQTAQQVFNQFNKPQQGAIPLRGGQSAPLSPTYKYEDLLRAYNRNPDVEDSWTPQLKADFWKETQARQKLQGG